jgi:hypothetical protein
MNFRADFLRPAIGGAHRGRSRQGTVAIVDIEVVELMKKRVGLGRAACASSAGRGSAFKG